jgi:hypothetical protein
VGIHPETMRIGKYRLRKVIEATLLEQSAQGCAVLLFAEGSA